MRCEKCVQQMKKKNKKNWTTLTVIVVFWLRADRGAGPGGPSIKMAYTTTTTKQRRRRIRYDDSTQAKERVGGRGKHSNSFFTRCCAIRSKEKGVRMSVCVCVCERDHHFHKSISLQGPPVGVLPQLGNGSGS